jgi:hypothetical protein
MGYQVVMTDLDGTLLNHQHAISEENHCSLTELDQKNIKIVFASGRMYKAIKRITTEFEGKAIVVSCNGGYIVDEANKQVISETQFDFETSLKIICLLESQNLSHHFYTGDTVYASHKENSTMFQAMKGFLDELKINLIAHSPLGKFIHDGVKPHKFGVILDAETDYEGLIDALSTIEAIDYFKSSDTLLDIMPKGINKGYALEQVAAYLHLTPADFVACGDHENDIEMVQKAGVGIAASGYVASLGEVSDYRLDDKSPHVIAFINDTFF